jgi:uncharacterized protein (DUF58 family)
MFKTVILLCLACLSIPGFGQSAVVKRVTAATEDGLVFSAWLLHQRVKYGQVIEVHYQVENHGRKSVYLVIEEPADVQDSSGDITISAPYITDEHFAGSSEFRLIEIKRGAKQRGKFIIPGNLYQRAGVLPIDIGFSYIKDVRHVRDVLKVQPPVVLATEKRVLSSETEIVAMGGLTVDVY